MVQVSRKRFPILSRLTDHEHDVRGVLLIEEIKPDGIEVADGSDQHCMDFLTWKDMQHLAFELACFATDHDSDRTDDLSNRKRLVSGIADNFINLRDSAAAHYQPLIEMAMHELLDRIFGREGDGHISENSQ